MWIFPCLMRLSTVPIEHLSSSATSGFFKKICSFWFSTILKIRYVNGIFVVFLGLLPTIFSTFWFIISQGYSLIKSNLCIKPFSVSSFSPKQYRNHPHYAVGFLCLCTKKYKKRTSCKVDLHARGKPSTKVYRARDT